jgi:hypothetical protein
MADLIMVGGVVVAIAAIMSIMGGAKLITRLIVGSNWHVPAGERVKTEEKESE